MYVKKCEDQMYKTCGLSPNICSRIGSHISSKKVHHKIHYRMQNLQKGILKCGVGSWQDTWQGALKTWVGLTLHGKWQGVGSFRDRTWRGLDILNPWCVLINNGISGTLRMGKGVGYLVLCILKYSVYYIYSFFLAHVKGGNWKKRKFFFWLVLFS